VPGLERQLFGSLVGTHHHNLEVVPVEGYGELQDFKRQQIPIEEFEGVIGLRPGFPVIAEDGDGQAVTLWVTDVQDDHVEIDINHPMAGKTLFFDVEIVAIRDATAEEMAHGHPRGLDDTQGH
ncbi:MAG: peptidylprolyl isomerase, partial [Myxococcota bacterium]